MRSRRNNTTLTRKVDKWNPRKVWLIKRYADGHYAINQEVGGRVFYSSYRVRTTADALNIRKGPGTNYGVAGQIKGKGIYTIVAEAAGPGATKWGKLKSGAGWISLDYVTKL